MCWRIEGLIASAQGCASLTQWNRKNSAATTWARKNGLTRQISEMMGWDIKPGTEYVYEKLLKDASRFPSEVSWYKGSPAMHKRAINGGYFDYIVEQLGWE